MTARTATLDLFPLASERFADADPLWQGHAVYDSAVIAFGTTSFTAVVSPENLYTLGIYPGNSWETGDGEDPTMVELPYDAAEVVELLSYLASPPEGVDHLAWVLQRFADDGAFAHLSTEAERVERCIAGTLALYERTAIGNSNGAWSLFVNDLADEATRFEVIEEITETFEHLHSREAASDEILAMLRTAARQWIDTIRAEAAPTDDAEPEQPAPQPKKVNYDGARLFRDLSSAEDTEHAYATILDRLYTLRREVEAAGSHPVLLSVLSNEIERLAEIHTEHAADADDRREALLNAAYSPEQYEAWRAAR